VIDERGHGHEQAQVHIQADEIQTQKQVLDTRPHDHLPSPMDDTPQDTFTRLGVDVSDVRSLPPVGPGPALVSAPVAHVPPHSQTQTHPPPLAPSPSPPPSQTPLHTVPAPLTNGVVSSVSCVIPITALPLTDGVCGKRKSPDTSGDIASDDRPDKKMKWMEVEEQPGLKEVRVQ
jgi:hypothetical protein